MKYVFCLGKKDVCQTEYKGNACNECEFFNGEGVKETENPYWERITALAERQRAKGMSKYGFGLEANHADILERINHLQEELVDALMYCEWIKEGINGEIR